MREYFTGVFAVIALAVALGAIAYRGRRDITLKMAFGVLITYTVLVPIGNLTSGEVSLPELSPDFSEYTEDYVQVCKDAFADGVRRLISDKFALSYDDVSVAVFDFDFETLRAGRIKVILSGSAVIADRYKIEDYINGEELGRCEVEIRIG